LNLIFAFTIQTDECLLKLFSVHVLILYEGVKVEKKF